MSQSASARKAEQSRSPDESLAAGDALVDAFRVSGSPADFERIVARYAPLVFAECRRVTRDAHDAEDAAQLVFLALAIELRGGATLRRPAAWLQRVANRQALKLIRSRGRRKRREDAARRAEHALPEPLAMEIAERAQHAGAVREAIDALPERYRLPLVLHYFGGMSLEAIAGELRLNRPAVGTRLHRARKMLGEKLAERGITMSDAAITGVIATLVPAAVVANLMRSGAPMIAQVAPGTAFAHSVAAMVGLAGGGSPRPTVIAAAIAAILAASASGFAFVAPSSWTQAVRATLDVRSWTRRLAPTRPTFVPPVLPRVAEAESTMPSITTSPWVAFAPPPAIEAPVGAASAATDDPQPSEMSAMLERASPMPDASLTLTFPPPPVAVLARIGGELMPAREPAAKPRLADRSHAVDAASAVGAGSVTDGAMTVGTLGTARYDLAGGRLKVDALTLGAGVGSSGTLNVGNGEVVVERPATSVVIGQFGRGRLYLGTQDAPGRIVASPGADARVIVRATAQANGLIRGWGTVESGGTLTNNGRIEADGFEHVRSLDLCRFDTIANTIDNPRDGTNGWYARRGGRVVLPTLKFASGASTATWGESADDSTLDLVNSVRVTATGQPRDGAMKLSLRTVAGKDPLDVPLPIGVSIIGLFEVDAATLDAATLDFTVRYDHVAANATFPGELGVRLVAHGDAGWVNADSPMLSLFRRTVGGTFVGGIDLLAIVVNPWFGTFATPHVESHSSMRLVGASVTNVPEPTTILGVVAATALLPRRRRRA